MTELAAHLGPFLREHLPRDRGASPNTVETYAYSFQLLACFTAERLGIRPCQIEIEQLDRPDPGVSGSPRTKARKHDPYPE